MKITPAKAGSMRNSQVRVALGNCEGDPQIFPPKRNTTEINPRVNFTASVLQFLASIP
jgi:hypothetical protein